MPYSTLLAYYVKYIFPFQACKNSPKQPQIYFREVCRRVAILIIAAVAIIVATVIIAISIAIIIVIVIIVIIKLTCHC